MSENSPQGSFLPTLPYGSREPAHIHPLGRPERRTHTHMQMERLAASCHSTPMCLARVGDFFA